ncbi:hypothetical protein G6F46_015556 [Rhizopus delemar]|nr:hypothetical protein G6F54_013692 [Rhizopus delemar]KAG1487585.1 hypothetical protein G6F53_013712 [Rhizopus delemar]KAG1571629.1 hypothetical protein G6F47_013652 [Rhizopus delemar]KAG1580139.1 hypothetical protein G6F46_015556 [Rhizopus delemar]
MHLLLRQVGMSKCPCMIKSFPVLKSLSILVYPSMVKESQFLPSSSIVQQVPWRLWLNSTRWVLTVKAFLCFSLLVSLLPSSVLSSSMA